jgi:hypothetical protein
MGYNTYNGSYNGLTYNYENPPIIKGPALVFQTEIDGLTRSGRCFTHEKQDRQWKAKVKEVIDIIKDMKINKPISEEEASEFLNLMKHNEYNVVEQLRKTSTWISLMSFILSYEPHCNVL